MTLLAGLRVLDYGQYVAVPFATMLLADIGADVVKIEPPAGDEWRRYEPFAPGESRYFYALNRNKRSIALDLKSDEGRAASRALIASADAVVHNALPERARRFGLDRETVRSINPRCVWVGVSAFGSDGPDAARPAYDLIAQALSGLLLAQPRVGEPVPQRLGGLALADFTAGLLAAIGVLAGLVGRDGDAPGIEISLLGAALAVQAQRFVAVDGLDAPGSAPFTAPEDVAAVAERQAAADSVEPYYRAHRCQDGYVALACLNAAQRQSVCDAFGLEDPWIANPQAPPADDAEAETRRAHARRVEAGFAGLTVRAALTELGTRGVPIGELRRHDSLYEDAQARANGLVQDLDQPGVGRVRLLGNVFKVDGRSEPARRPAPRLDEHRGEVLP
jgi:crotonobetainyl-CoA:carnitine CoA-transferase CaiB-like acyl-CoA transferase